MCEVEYLFFLLLFIWFVFVSLGCFCFAVFLFSSNGKLGLFLIYYIAKFRGLALGTPLDPPLQIDFDKDSYILHLLKPELRSG